LVAFTPSRRPAASADPKSPEACRTRSTPPPRVERYEYTPYGERQVYFSPGTNDPEAYAPTSMSRRVVLSSVEQPYGLCEFGHQGLMHDESVGLIYNRARHLHPTWGRFLQREPMLYIEGANLYGYYAAMSGSLDPSGVSVYRVK